MNIIPAEEGPQGELSAVFVLVCMFPKGGYDWTGIFLLLLPWLLLVIIAEYLAVPEAG